MIDSQLLPFLRELQQNNNKAWFNPRKAEYKRIRRTFQAELEEAAQEIAFFDRSIADRLGDPATVKVFRIYRDVRFSKNKEPLKTNMGGYVSAGGERPAYYLHVEPGRCFAGGGIYHPSPAVLKAIREEIAESYEELRAILEAPAFRSIYPHGLDKSEALKTAPRAYSVDHPAIQFLRLTSFFVARPFSDEQITAGGFHDELMRSFEAQYPLHAYLDKAMQHKEKPHG